MTKMSGFQRSTRRCFTGTFRLLFAGFACVIAQAAATPPVARLSHIVSIEKLAKPVRSRILLGTSSEGTDVEATTHNGQYTRIVSEALNETGYTISDFRFDDNALTRARIVRVGYRGYPDGSVKNALPHTHLVIDPTDVVINEQNYDFTSNAPGCATPDCVTEQKSVRAEAAMYVRLMNTRPPPGKAGDNSYWDCVDAGSQDCNSFKPD